MSDNDRSVKVESSSTALAIALLFIFFWGDPDMSDAIIYWLKH